MRVFAVPRSIARSFENRPCSQSKIIARSGLLAPRLLALDSLGYVLERDYVGDEHPKGQPLLAHRRHVSTLGPPAPPLTPFWPMSCLLSCLLKGDPPAQPHGPLTRAQDPGTGSG